MIHFNTHTEFLKHAKPEHVIIELGDQLMDIGAETQFMRSDEYYRWKHQLKITSIDIHGKNRVNQADLSKDQKFVATGNIVTDFGTIEHVSDLYNALLNTHNLCHEVAVKCGYEVISIYEQHPYSESNPDIEVVAVLRKSKKEFPSKEELQIK